MKAKMIDTELLGVCDIDDTLLAWHTETPIVCTFVNPHSGKTMLVNVNEGNLAVLKNWLDRGATFIVWSRSGRLWAKAALEALGIDHKNIYISPKPMFYIDDKVCNDWMGEQVFVPPNSRWGKGTDEP